MRSGEVVLSPGEGLDEFQRGVLQGVEVESDIMGEL